MIIIRNVEELEAERERQRKEWITTPCGFEVILLEDYRFYFILAFANLSKADLRVANLRGVNFWVANLSGADLTEADLTEADLKRADLSGADLKKADLSGADLQWANLCEANLEGAKIKNTIITQSQYDELGKLYSHEFMSGFVVKELEA